MYIPRKERIKEINPMIHKFQFKETNTFLSQNNVDFGVVNSRGVKQKNKWSLVWRSQSFSDVA
jgi:hypothetical protein